VRKIYFGSWFKRVQFMVTWTHELGQNIMESEAGGRRDSSSHCRQDVRQREKERGREKWKGERERGRGRNWQPDIIFNTIPLRPTSSSLSPPPKVSTTSQNSTTSLASSTQHMFNI
jgi:hypothetical protein